MTHAFLRTGGHPRITVPCALSTARFATILFHRGSSSTKWIPWWQSGEEQARRVPSPRGARTFLPLTWPAHDPLRHPRRISLQKREIPGAGLKPPLSYFRGRHVWVLEADESPPRLAAYPKESG